MQSVWGDRGSLTLASCSAPGAGGSNWHAATCMENVGIGPPPTPLPLPPMPSGMLAVGMRLIAAPATAPTSERRRRVRPRVSVAPEPKSRRLFGSPPHMRSSWLPGPEGGERGDWGRGRE